MYSKAHKHMAHKDHIKLSLKHFNIVLRYAIYIIFNLERFS